MKPSFLSAATAASLVLAATVFPPAAVGQPAQDTLRIRLNEDIRSTDPGVNRDSNTDAVVAHLVEGLVAFREDTSVGPLLAQSVDVSPDGKTYTFKLRPGLKFSNGAPLTSDDVLFAWHRYMDPATNWRCLAEFDGHGIAKVLKVEAKGPLTVVYTLDKPEALFLTTLARTDCGGAGIYHRSSLDAAGKWREPVGTGPFVLGEWKRGQYVELRRNDQYVALPGKRDGNTGNKSPGVAKVRFVVIPDASSAKAALLSGGVDLLSDVPEEDVGAYKARSDITVDAAPTMDENGLLFQTRDPLLKDVRIRRAFALALDVPQIAETATDGHSPASRSVIPRPSPFYGAPQAVLPARDLAGARRLLAAAGYRGQPIKILTTKRYPYLFTIAVLTQAMAQEAGIHVDVEVLDWATLQDRYVRGDYQMLAYSYSSRLDPSLSYQMFSGSKDLDRRKVWDNPAALDLLAQSMVIGDKTRRQALFDQLETKLREDTPAVFMYSQIRVSAAKSYVKGYGGWPLGHMRAWGVSLAAH
jgi:peptide/nickel transport system substrate-binding protein